MSDVSIQVEHIIGTMETARQESFSLDAYNRLEEENALRYEYHSGEVFAMAGGDPKHGVIANNITGAINFIFTATCHHCVSMYS